jgi:hypothetical protein
MEKPLARVPASVIDILGTSTGSGVVIESLGANGKSQRIRRISLRITPIRDYPAPLIARMRMGVPDYQDLMGTEDLPPIHIDLVARKRLDTLPGSVVYVRPSIPSLALKEFTSVSLVLIVATFSAAALRNLIVAASAAGLYLVLAAIVIIGRLR